MMSALPPVDDIRHLLGRLHANDIAWFQQRDTAGDLAWIHDRLPESDRSEMNARIGAGDLNWVRQRLGVVLRHESVEGLDTSGLDLWAASSPTATGADATLESSSIHGAATGGIAVATEAAATTSAREERRRRAALLLLPVGLLAAIGLGVGLNRWADNGKNVVVGTVLSADTTASAETAAASETTVAATTAVAADSVVAAADIVDTAAGTGGFTKLTAALQAAGLTDALKGPGPFTVFAPNDAAFDALPDGVLTELLKPKNKATLAKVLTYHVLAQSLPSSEIKKTIASGASATFTTLEGSKLDIAPTADTIRVNDVEIVAPDVAASNGIIHVIDRVLLPKDVSLVSAANPGSTTTVTPTTTATTTPATTTPAATASAATKNILDTASGAGNFSTLAGLVADAGLTETLNGPGPFTVFAPDDAAFAKLPPALVEALKRPENRGLLGKILTYHVVPGALKAADLKSGDVATVEGSQVKVVVDNGSVGVNDAKVTTADIAATNGVIHVIDSVLLPPAVDVTALTGPSATTNAAGDATPESLTVYFASGIATFDGAANAKISAAIVLLSGVADGTKITVIGHADTTGVAAANLALSKARADNVVAALKAGLAAKASALTFDAQAKGSTEPVADLAKSRRVTIEIAAAR